MNTAPKIPNNQNEVVVKKSVIGWPVKIFAFIVLAPLAGLIIYGALKTKPTQTTPSKPLVQQPKADSLERYKQIVNNLKTAGVTVTRDAMNDTDHPMPMSYLGYNWQSFEFSSNPQSGDMFFLSGAPKSEKMDFAIWFHMNLDSPEEIRMAISKEINQVLRAVVVNPQSLVKIQAFVSENLKTIPPTTNGDLATEIDGYSVSLASSQDQSDKFMLRLNMKIPKQ